VAPLTGLDDVAFPARAVADVPCPDDEARPNVSLRDTSLVLEDGGAGVGVGVGVGPAPGPWSVMVPPGPVQVLPVRQHPSATQTVLRAGYA